MIKVSNFCEQDQGITIIKCIYIIFQELFSEFDYLLKLRVQSYVVVEDYKREKSDRKDESSEVQEKINEQTDSQTDTQSDWCMKEQNDR